MRYKLSQELQKKLCKYQLLTSYLLFYLLPISFLEGFNFLRSKSDMLPLPMKPKLIFTSSYFDTTDIFKIWLVDKIASGSKYIVGQHGNNYGTSLNFANETIEENTADAFLTWGWCSNKKNIKQAFMLKNLGLKIKKNSSEKILFIQEPFTFRYKIWDQVHNYKNFLDNQFIFLNLLNLKVKNNILIRLHNDENLPNLNLKRIWFARYPDLKYDLGKKKILKLYKNASLIVHSYDSTGVLETLRLDIPTIFFMNSGFVSLKSEAVYFYRLLYDAKILFTDMLEAASHINKHFPDFSEWWNTSKVRTAREIFCKQYARDIKNPISTLKNLLMQTL